jgi:hypothetical protein
MDVLGRYRNLIVLVGVLFAQILGLAVQVRRTTDSESDALIRIWAVGAVTPLRKGAGMGTNLQRQPLAQLFLPARGARREPQPSRRRLSR